MKTKQIEVVNKLKNENVITLNGIEANVYPCKNGVLVDNNPLEGTEDEWDEMVVGYSLFIDTVKNNDGRFKIT